MELLQVDMGIYHFKMHFKLVSYQMSYCYLGSESKTNMIKLYFEFFIANYFKPFNKNTLYLQYIAVHLQHICNTIIAHMQNIDRIIQ